MDPFTLIPGRTSRRSYTVQPLSASELEQITGLLDQCKQGPLGTSLSFRLVNKRDRHAQKLKLGTYGFIQGAQFFVAGQTAQGKQNFLDYGYVLEKLILEFTGMGLGTCWLGGTFDRSEFARAINLQPPQVIPAITPVGYATSKRGLGDRLIRAGAGSKRRKDWEEIFFRRGDLRPLHPDEAGVATRWLDMLRIGPSASNNQPWRILHEEQGLHLYLSRKPGYQKSFGQVDIQMLDMGIALCHLDLCAQADGTRLNWHEDPHPDALFDWEYIMSLNF